MSASKERTAKTWYLAQCKARQDARAEANLQNQGFACFRPTYKRERNLRGQTLIVEESLFPGYLFVQLSAEDNWAPLRSTRGITRIVGFGGQPLAINEGLIEQLQQRSELLIRQDTLVPGEVVRIWEGPFSELEAVFLAMDGAERVVLLLNFLQREQKVFVPLSSICKL